MGVCLSYVHGYSDGLCGVAGGNGGRVEGVRAPAVLVLEEMMGLEGLSKRGSSNDCSCGIVVMV